ncbi:hypothetical protein RCLKYE_96 [Rhodobacter phage RcLkye]|nr:hypothetical protein RCLKYE_96 [Rhodobacter phage RcLkye]
MIGRASLDRGAAVPVSAVALGPICGAALPCPSRCPVARLSRCPRADLSRCPAMPFPLPRGASEPLP